MVTTHVTMKEDNGEHGYDSLRNLDGHSDSDTDVEEWSGQPRQRRRRTVWKAVKAYRWMADTILLMVIIGLLVEKKWKSQTGHRYELAGDISGFAPQCRGKSFLLDIEGGSTDSQQSLSKSSASSPTLSSLPRRHPSSGA